MQPADLPLEFYRGDTARMRLKLFDGAGAPVDLTAVVAKAEVRDRPGGSTVVPLECTITLPNIIDVVLTPSNSIKLPRQGAWDLQLTYASGDIKTPVAGQVRVTDDVTDSTPYVEHH